MSVICVLGDDLEGVCWWPAEGETASYPLAVSRDWAEDALLITAMEEMPVNDVPGES